MGRARTFLLRQRFFAICVHTSSEKTMHSSKLHQEKVKEPTNAPGQQKADPRWETGPVVCRQAKNDVETNNYPRGGSWRGPADGRSESFLSRLKRKEKNETRKTSQNLSGRRVQRVGGKERRAGKGKVRASKVDVTRE